MSSIFATQGVVLHLGRYSDAHVLIEVLSAEHGRLTLLARGARASKRRFAGILDVFTSLHMQIQPGRGLATLQAAEALAPRLGIRRDLDAITRASHLCNCVRLLTAAQQEAKSMLHFLEQGLDLLDKLAVPQAAVSYLGLLNAAGIFPNAAALPAMFQEVARGAPVHSTQLADALEKWTRDWVARHTGRKWAAML